MKKKELKPTKAVGEMTVCEMMICPCSVSQTHPSVIEKGDILKCKVVSVSPPMFGCHLCPRFMTKSERAIQRHFLNHEANAVHFEGKFITATL